MREILEHFADAEFHADWDEARSRVGDDVTPADLARTAAQRRMDALHAIFLAAAATPPGSKPPEPAVNIVVDQATFEAAIAARSPTSPRRGHGRAGDPTKRRCETIDGDLVDPCDAVIAAFVGHVRRVVFNSQSCTINLGVASRLFRGASRAGVVAPRHPTSWPGCGTGTKRIAYLEENLGPPTPISADDLRPHPMEDPRLPHLGGPRHWFVPDLRQPDQPDLTKRAVVGLPTTTRLDDVSAVAARPRNADQSSTRSTRDTSTVSPACLAIALRTSALIGSLWVPSPMAMNELRNG